MMRRDINMIAALSTIGTLGMGATLARSSPASRSPDDFDDLSTGAQRAIATSQREVNHITTPKPLSKRAKRRARGKAKP